MRGFQLRELALLAVALLACGPELDPADARGFDRCRELRPQAVPEGANLVLVVNDAMRGDRAGVYGGPASTPRFDAFARANLLFRAAVSAAPWTKPAMASLFTSLHPSQHGVSEHPKAQRGDGRLELADPRTLGEADVLGEEFDTLAESLRRTGLRTAAFVANPWIVSALGFAQGFEVYDDSFARWDAPGEDVTRAALAWLAAIDSGERFFLYLHYMDTHLPYGKLRAADLETQRARLAADRRPVPREARDYLRGMKLESGEPLSQEVEPKLALLELAYDRGMESFDGAFGLLLDALERRSDWPRTAVVVTSDHGEAFFERGWGNHGRSLYQVELVIPLAARLPGVVAQAVEVDCPVSHVDLAPTLCDYLRAACPAASAGLSLLAPAQDARASPRYLVSEGLKSYPRHRAIQNGRYKLIYEPEGALGPDLERHRPEPEEQAYALYHLAADPGELRNLLAAPDPSRDALEIAELLKQALAGAVAPFTRPTPASAPLDAELRRRLRDLGYLRDTDD